MGTVTNRDGHNQFTIERGGTRISEPQVQLFSITVQSTGYVSGETTRATANFTVEELLAICVEIERHTG